LAAAALTITSLREQFIDFSEPFLNLGISILYKVIIFIQFFLIFVFYHIIIKNKRPEKKKNQLFSFLSPFEVTVWICVIVAYFGNFVNSFKTKRENFYVFISIIVVSIFLYLIARISPYEWKKENDSNKKKTVILTNQFSIRNTFW
jgi:hypothetical protein